MGSDKCKTAQKTIERSNKDQIFSGKTAPIRVAQVIGKWKGGGVESVVMNYYRHIDRNKIQFDFLIDEDSTNIPTEEIEKLGGKIILIPPYQKLPKYIKALKKIFKNNKYKIVHSHISTLSVFPLYAAKKAGIKVRIAHSHSTTNQKEFLRNILKSILKIFSKRNATNYFACSEIAGRYLFGNKTFDDEKVVVIRNAIDLKEYSFDETARNDIREELSIKENDLVIGHAGRFVKTKNHAMLIEIFSKICKDIPDAKLLLIGEGPLLEKIKNKVSKMQLDSNVMFLGQRKDMNKIYSAIDQLILPSLYEGFGMVAIEAQACGLLVSASDKVPDEANMGNITFNKTFDDYIKHINVAKKRNTANLEKYDIAKNAGILSGLYMEMCK